MAEVRREPAFSPLIPSLVEARPDASRRRAKSWPGAAFSIGAHAAVFLGAWWYVHHATLRKPPPSIVTAKLVQLGKPRDEKLLPRLETAAEQLPSAGTETTGKTISLSGQSGPPAPDAATLKANDAIDRQKRLLEALAKLQTEGPSAKKPQERVGREDGAVDGDAQRAEEGDRYAALVVKALKDHFVVPNTISQQERLYLFCELNLHIAADGVITRFTIEKSSGNAQFDRAVEATIQRAELPPPPDILRTTYFDDGLPVRFKP
jgi:TonB family protein